MAAELRTQNRPPFLGLPVVPYLPEPGIDLPTLDTELLPAGLAKENELALSVLTAVMGEAQKIKGIGAAVLLAGVLSFKAAEAENTSLFGVEFQPEPRKALPKRDDDTLRLICMLYQADVIIHVAYQLTRPLDP